MGTINPIFVFLVLFMTVLGALGAFFLKKVSGTRFSDLLRRPALYFGVLLYGISMIVNIGLLRFFSYSLILPLTALSYVWTMLLGCFFLSERLSLRKLLGTAFILLGALLIV